MQREASEQGSAGVAPPIVDETLARSGRPLDSSIRGFMEPRFGADFSGVRIHDDPQAADSARSVSAHAYTVGNHIVFGSDRFQPDTEAGQRLLAHELAHTIQQNAAGKPQTQAVSRSGLRLARAKVEHMSACIRPVRIADDDGKHPTTLPSFDSVKKTWAKCCVDFTVKAADTVKKSAYKELDESKNDTPTVEEKALFTDAGGGGGCVSVFVADTFKQDGKVSKDISGGGGTYDGGKADPKIVAVEGVDPTIVAHEMGHALGIGPHGPAHTIMNVSANRHDQKEEEKVNKAQCDKARTAPTATVAGKDKDCDVPD